MNTVNIIGRTTKAIELKQAGETVVTNLTLAVDRPTKKDETDFIPVVAWGKTAELLSKYAGKGSQIGVEGRIQSRSYVKDGKVVYVTEVVANRVTLLATKKPEEIKIEG